MKTHHPRHYGGKNNLYEVIKLLKLGLGFNLEIQ